MIIALVIGLMALFMPGVGKGAGRGVLQTNELRARLEQHVASPERRRVALRAVDHLERARVDGFRRVEAELLTAAPVLQQQRASEAELRGVASHLLAAEADGDDALVRLRGALHGVLTREEWAAVFE
ncbi:MAG: hypothetical protein IT380_17475 [Myxococcales bacterium]|nr:hypothetical protein [Myxococcales bacterium]